MDSSLFWKYLDLDSNLIFYYKIYIRDFLYSSTLFRVVTLGLENPIFYPHYTLCQKVK